MQKEKNISFFSLPKIYQLCKLLFKNVRELITSLVFYSEYSIFEKPSKVIVENVACHYASRLPKKGERSGVVLIKWNGEVSYFPEHKILRSF